jgi:hypothetical protein
MTYAESVDREREPEARRQPRRDVDPRGAGVVGAVHPAVELHEQPLRPQRRPVHVVDTPSVRVLERLLREVRRDDAVVRDLPGRARVLAHPDPDGRDADRQSRRVPRPRADRMQRQASSSRRPLLSPARLVPQAAVQLPRQPAVAALEQRRRIDAGEDESVLLARCDLPDPLDARVLASGKRRTLRLPPLAGGVLGQEDVRPELPVRDRRQVRPRARVLDRVLDGHAREGARGDIHRPTPRPAEHEQAFPRSDQDFGLAVGPAGDRADDVDAGVRCERGGAVDALSADEDRDVPSDPPLIVEHPPRELRVAPLESAERLRDGRALDEHLAVSARELAQRRPERDDGHGTGVYPARRRRRAGECARRAAASGYAR